MVDDKERAAWAEIVERVKKGEKVTRAEMIERAGSIYAQEKVSLERLRETITQLLGSYCDNISKFGWALYLFPFDDPENAIFLGAFADEVDLPKLLRNVADDMEKGGCQVEETNKKC